VYTDANIAMGAESADFLIFFIILSVEIVCPFCLRSYIDRVLILVPVICSQDGLV
jgi:hypothetical protein